MKIVNEQTAPLYTWGEACSSWVLVDTDSLSVKKESMPPDTKEKLHFHVNAQQFFYILNGTAQFYVQNEKFSVTEHQGIIIKNNTQHFIANETDTILEFLVVSQPSTNNDRINVHTKS